MKLIYRLTTIRICLRDSVLRSLKSFSLLAVCLFVASANADNSELSVLELLNNKIDHSTKIERIEPDEAIQLVSRSSAFNKRSIYSDGAWVKMSANRKGISFSYRNKNAQSHIDTQIQEALPDPDGFTQESWYLVGYGGIVSKGYSRVYNPGYEAQSSVYRNGVWTNKTLSRITRDRIQRHVGLLRVEDIDPLSSAISTLQKLKTDKRHAWFQQALEGKRTLIVSSIGYSNRRVSPDEYSSERVAPEEYSATGETKKGMTEKGMTGNADPLTYVFKVSDSTGELLSAEIYRYQDNELQALEISEYNPTEISYVVDKFVSNQIDNPVIASTFHRSEVTGSIDNIGVKGILDAGQIPGGSTGFCSIASKSNSNLANGWRWFNCAGWDNGTNIFLTRFGGSSRSNSTSHSKYSGDYRDFFVNSNRDVTGHALHEWKTSSSERLIYNIAN